LETAPRSAVYYERIRFPFSYRRIGMRAAKSPFHRATIIAERSVNYRVVAVARFDAVAEFAA